MPESSGHAKEDEGSDPHLKEVRHEGSEAGAASSQAGPESQSFEDASKSFAEGSNQSTNSENGGMRSEKITNTLRIASELLMKHAPSSPTGSSDVEQVCLSFLSFEENAEIR